MEVDFATSTGEQVDFCVTANQDINDLNITLLPITEARPGFTATYKLVVKNLGTQSMDNITASLLFDEAMQSFVEANPVTSATTTNSLEFTIATLAPFESWETGITMQTFTPPAVNGDDLLNFTATVLPNTDDYTPNDNIFSLEQIVVNSYDPNYKQVLQGETIVMEQTSEYLDYLIRFQNTGTASAINIRVEDELHDNLDWSTLSITSASHDYQVEVTNSNEVEFIFDDIYLPVESQNEPESHGFIAYKIKPITTVAVGDVMSGNASIYFDYNAPIITNTVTTEVVDVLGVGEHVLSSLVTVYPNPISEGVYLEMNDGVELISAKLYNVQGRLLLETKETTNHIKNRTIVVWRLYAAFGNKQRTIGKKSC
nr:T9SS type A sorting domain-containing protein [Mangrovimonas sp. DI 80]